MAIAATAENAEEARRRYHSESERSFDKLHGCQFFGALGLPFTVKLDSSFAGGASVGSAFPRAVGPVSGTFPAKRVVPGPHMCFRALPKPSRVYVDQDMVDTRFSANVDTFPIVRLEGSGCRFVRRP